ncbi:MAG TPA: SpoIIE family protein phosphatase, partial [Vicinamibacteria bacterium]|nr:SpoIIE family protein phosphatase [Vicinamibacteria bacterium]
IRLPFGKGMAGATALDGTPLLVEDVRRNPHFDPEVDRRTGFQTENALCAPIRERDGKVVAVVQLLNKAGGFSEQDLEFLELMGVPVAQALANAHAQQVLVERQRLLKEMELARRIQALLLPSELPEVRGIDVAGRMVSSRQVGGDYYDVVPMDGGRTLFIVADVSGKGVPAALVMSNLQAALWATASLGPELDAWAEHLNELLYGRLGGSRYVTAFLLLLDPEQGAARYVNAGHPPGLVLEGKGIRRLGATGAPLGLLPAQRYEVDVTPLAEGSSVLLYSDGLTEAADAAGNELGVEGVERLLSLAAGEPAASAVEQILAGVSSYASGETDRDDRTLVLLRRVTRPGPASPRR